MSKNFFRSINFPLIVSLMLILPLSASATVSSAAGQHKQTARPAANARARPARQLDQDQDPDYPRWRAFSEVGRGVAIIFTPDLARPANRRFYEGLGFLYIETADWTMALNEIINHNGRGDAIDTVILETHGNWGHGLKLQEGKSPSAARSYISLGALQELLAHSGVRDCILSACNAGRLLRPDIYNRLDERELEPANFGIINASPGYDARESDVRLLRRRESQLEMLSAISINEFPAPLRRRLLLDDEQGAITISDLFLQYVMHDNHLHLTDIGYVEAISRNASRPAQSEALITRFFSALAQIDDDSN